jgi:hypothetical protein
LTESSIAATSSTQAFDDFVLRALRSRPPAHWRQHLSYAVIGLQVEVAQVLSVARTWVVERPPDRRTLVEMFRPLEYYVALTCHQFDRWSGCDPSEACHFMTVEECASDMVVAAGGVAIELRDWIFHGAYVGPGAANSLARLISSRCCLYRMLGIEPEEIWRLACAGRVVGPYGFDTWAQSPAASSHRRRVLTR